MKRVCLIGKDVDGGDGVVRNNLGKRKKKEGNIKMGRNLGFVYSSEKNGRMRRSLTFRAWRTEWKKVGEKKKKVQGLSKIAFDCRV